MFYKIEMFSFKIENIFEIIELMRQEVFLVPTLITILVIIIKLSINRKLKALDYKICIIQMPYEIIALALGFIFSKLGTSTNIKTSYVLFSLVIFVIVAFIINGISEDIQKLAPKQIVYSAISYILSIFMYITAVILK